MDDIFGSISNAEIRIEDIKISNGNKKIKAKNKSNFRTNPIEKKNNNNNNNNNNNKTINLKSKLNFNKFQKLPSEEHNDGKEITKLEDYYSEDYLKRVKELLKRDINTLNDFFDKIASNYKKKLQTILRDDYKSTMKTIMEREFYTLLKNDIINVTNVQYYNTDQIDYINNGQVKDKVEAKGSETEDDSEFLEGGGTKQITKVLTKESEYQILLSEQAREMFRLIMEKSVEFKNQVVTYDRLQAEYIKDIDKTALLIIFALKSRQLHYFKDLDEVLNFLFRSARTNKFKGFITHFISIHKMKIFEPPKRSTHHNYDYIENELTEEIEQFIYYVTTDIKFKKYIKQKKRKTKKQNNNNVNFGLFDNDEDVLNI